MKSTHKVSKIQVSKIQVSKIPVLGLAVIAAIVFVLLFTACGGGGGGGDDGDDNKGNPTVTFDNIDDFFFWLEKQPDNTADTPYNVKLVLTTDLYFGDMGYVLYQTKKYVSLDLSGSTLTEIAPNAFFSSYINIYLISIIIPNGVTSIGSSAFGNCQRLTSVIIPNSVTMIGGLAFYRCTSLTSVTIPNSVTSIGQEAFSLCGNKFTSVTFETGSDILSSNFGNNAFPGGNTGSQGNELRTAYLTGKAGTYTRAANNTSNWTKQE